VGIEVKADPLNRSPKTATFPDDSVKRADPRLPTIALNPGRALSTASVLPCGGKVTDEVPITFPALLTTVITTVVATPLGLTVATPVVKLVSSQMRVLEVAVAIEKGTTASWSALPTTLWRKITDPFPHWLPFPLAARYASPTTAPPDDEKATIASCPP
jgi:hypothetical protein